MQVTQYIIPNFARQWLVKAQGSRLQIELFNPQKFIKFTIDIVIRIMTQYPTMGLTMPLNRDWK